MGFLGNLYKVNTLELFLTDKGKELMLKENGLGLQDLISRFSLDDADYDYRRTSETWVNGISPNPDGSLFPYGTTQGFTNNIDGLPPNNPCNSCESGECAPLSGTCWYDMPDVRGSRGNKVLTCYVITGVTTGTTTGCTECQCLPAVFINKRGPVEVIDSGCPCPNGTISEECCEGGSGGDGSPGGSGGGGTPQNPITTGICGPIPRVSSGAGDGGGRQVIGQSGIAIGPTIPIITDLYQPKSYTNFRSGLNDVDSGIGINKPPLNTSSKVHNYSSYYSIDFNINLKQYYEKDILNWDVEFESTSRYGDHLIQEGDGSKFYWFISSGYKKSRLNPKETKACISPSLSTINSNKMNRTGINIAYLKGYWNQAEKEDYTSVDNANEDPIIKHEFCVTMVYTYKSKLLKKTKRFSVIGNKYGYKLNVKS